MNEYKSEASWDEINKFIAMDYSPFAYSDSEIDKLKKDCYFYQTQSFLTLQNSIDKMIINHKATNELSDEELFNKFTTKSYLVKKERV